MRKRIAVKGTLGGLDASIGGLAYAVAFIGRGGAALSALQAQGMDLTLQTDGSALTCQASSTAAECDLPAVRSSTQALGMAPAAAPGWRIGRGGGAA